MTRAKLAIGTFLAMAIACSSLDSESALKSRANAPGTESKGDDDDQTSNGSAPPYAGAPTATGVVVVHAATFPSFRLCFENMPELVPQPDKTVMPEANVVGVEMGSLVRLDPLAKAPGKVYVVRQAAVESFPGSTEPTCGERVGTGGNQGTLGLLDFFEAGTIDQPVGEGRVDVLAITGCGPRPMIDSLDGVPLGKSNISGCPNGYDPTYGTVRANVLQLPFSAQGRTQAAVPVQIFNLSPSAKALGASISISYGAVPGTEGDLVLPVGEPFVAGAQHLLEIDQRDEQNFGKTGFTLTATVPDAGAPIRVEQSLANIQDLSAPGQLPTTYYQAASNYALLLIGDPSHTPSVPKYSERRALHLLAVPVQDPTRVDAGAEDAGPDAGVQ